MNEWNGALEWVMVKEGIVGVAGEDWTMENQEEKMRDLRFRRTRMMSKM